MRTSELRVGQIIVRVALVATGLIALSVVAAAFYLRGVDKPETWATTAAALAIITALVSAWSSRRVIELQEAAQRPNVIPSFDFTSRYGLAMFRLTNRGGSVASNVSLEWDVPLKNSDGKVIGFPKRDDGAAIPVVLSGESIPQIIDVPNEFLAQHPDRPYSGYVVFQDAYGSKYRRFFLLDARPYADSPGDEDELKKTYYEMQKIPKLLEEIKSAIGGKAKV